jgi:hypothetical protein
MIPEGYDGLILKPELNEDLLMHFGIKGMRWGHRKARPVSLSSRRGTRSSGDAAKRKPKKAKKQRKGYSMAQYDKYRAQGMSHDQAVSAARDHRRKTIRNIAIGAAAVTVAALVARKVYNSGFNLKGLSQQQVYEKRLAKAAARKDYKNFKFKNQADYLRAKESAVQTEWMKAGRKGDLRDFRKYIDEDTIKRYGKSLYTGTRRYRKYY